MTDDQKSRMADRFERIGASKGELCGLYECDYRTLRAWCRAIEGELGAYERRYTPKQVRRIFGHLGRV